MLRNMKSERNVKRKGTRTGTGTVTGLGTGAGNGAEAGICCSVIIQKVIGVLDGGLSKINFVGLRSSFYIRIILKYLI